MWRSQVGTFKLDGRMVVEALVKDSMPCVTVIASPACLMHVLLRRFSRSVLPGDACGLGCRSILQQHQVYAAGWLLIRLQP